MMASPVFVGCKVLPGLKTNDPADDWAMCGKIDEEAVVGVIDSVSTVTGRNGERFVEGVSDTAEHVPHEVGRSAKPADDAPSRQIEILIQSQSALCTDRRIDPGVAVFRGHGWQNTGAELELGFNVLHPNAGHGIQMRAVLFDQAIAQHRCEVQDLRIDGDTGKQGARSRCPV